MALREYQDLFGISPHEAREFRGNGNSDHVGLFASYNELAIAFTQPDLHLPTDVLEDFGLFFQSQLQVTAHFGGIAIGAGPFDEGSVGMGVTRFH